MNPYLLVDLKQRLELALIPHDYESINSLMLKLSHRSHVICALEAAKMVLPIWEEYISKPQKLRMTEEQKEHPKKAIETVEDWLRGEATEDEIKKAYTGAFGIYPNHEATVSYVAITTAYIVAYPNSSTTKATEVIDAAAGAAVEGLRPPLPRLLLAKLQQFFIDWWNRCYPLIQKEYDILCKQISGNI